MATYIAITTTNARQNGWKALAVGEDAEKVRAKAESLITPVGVTPDIYAETELKNLRVVSKTRAKKFGVNYDDNESWCTNHMDAVFVK